MAENSNNPGDVELGAITLTSSSSGQSLNIINQVVAINIWESILTPTIYAELVIYDPIDLLNFFPIRGEETIDLEWQTPGAETRNYTFSVIKPSIVRTGINDKDKQYTLRCISQDHLKNAKVKFSKKYKDTGGNIIQNILKEQLSTSKQYQGDDTKGTEDILIAKMHPFQAIDLVRRRSVSDQYLSSSWCFFEDKNGYNFYTLESMMQNSRGTVGGRTYFYDASVLEDLANITMMNILGYKNLAFGDTVNTIFSGSFKNVTRKFDLFTKQLGSIDYNNLEKQGQFIFPDGTGNPFSSSQFESSYNDKTPQFFMTPVDTSRTTDYRPDMIGPRQSYVQKILQNIAQIKVYGDSTLELGEIVDVRLPSVTGFTGGMSEEAKLLSGNFLVSKIRHLISLIERRVYYQSLELLKGNVRED
jgi:hypothetical protein